MKNKLPKILGITMILVSIGIFIISYLYSSILLLVIGIISIVVSIFSLFLSTTIEMFKQDKVLDLDALKAQGLTIIQCDYCQKMNVLEDKYCIFCGELLGEQHE